MDEFSADEAEAPSPRNVARDAAAAALILFCTFGLERISDYLFPDGVPVLVGACLTLSDFCLLLAFVQRAWTLVQSIVSHSHSGGISLRRLAGAFASSHLIGEIGRAFKTSVGAGALSGSAVATLSLVIILLGTSPWWIRFALFLVGAGLVLTAIALTLHEAKILEGAKSGVTFVLVYAFVFTIGAGILILIFGSEVEAHSGVLQATATFLFGLLQR